MPERGPLTSHENALFIYNPHSGTASEYENQAAAHSIAESFQSVGWNVELKPSTSKLRSMTDLATEAAKKYDIVGSLSGDGGRNQVAAGLLHTGVPHLHVPRGTLDIWAEETNTPRDPLQVAEQLSAGEIRTIDTGEVNGNPFTLMFGVLTDAEVIHRVQPLEQPKRGKGKGIYTREAMRTIPRQKSVHAQLKIDDADPEEVDLIQMWGGITKKLAVFELRPEAIADDGWMEISAYTGGRNGYDLVVPFLSDVWRQKVVSSRGKRNRVFTQAKEITLLDLSRPVALHADGEPLPYADQITARVDESSLLVVTPAGPNDLFSKPPLQ